MQNSEAIEPKVSQSPVSLSVELKTDDEAPLNVTSNEEPNPQSPVIVKEEDADEKEEDSVPDHQSLSPVAVAETDSVQTITTTLQSSAHPVRTGRTTNQLQYILKSVLSVMMKHPFAWPFLKPVDAAKLGLHVCKLIYYCVDFIRFTTRACIIIYPTGMRVL